MRYDFSKLRKTESLYFKPDEFSSTGWYYGTAVLMDGLVQLRSFLIKINLR